MLIKAEKELCGAVGGEVFFIFYPFLGVAGWLGWLTVCGQELEVAKRGWRSRQGLCHTERTRQVKRVTVSLTFINSANNDTSHRQ